MKHSNAKSLWIAVRVERGFAAEPRLFLLEEEAYSQIGKWKAQMNPDYDDADVFRVNIPSGRQKNRSREH